MQTYKVLTLFEISISFNWPLKFFGIAPSAPTTTSITFVFALQSLDIPFSLFAFNAAVARYRNVYDEDFVVVLNMVSYVRSTVIYLTIGYYYYYYYYYLSTFWCFLWCFL